jgi:hypothetical protein
VIANKAQESVAPGVDLALGLTFCLALSPVGSGDFEHLPDLVPRLLVRL